MPKFFRTLAAVLLVIAPAVTPIEKASAATGEGDIWATARDAYTGYPIDACATAINQADGLEYSLDVDTSVPAGTYDVTFVDCVFNAYAPVTIYGVEVLDPSDPDWVTVARPIAWMALETKSAIAGYVVDAYSGYPIEQACVQLVDPDTDAAISEHWTDEDGLYQAVVDPGTTVKIRVKTKRSVCNTPGPDYQFQYHPDTNDPAQAEIVTTAEGRYVVSHFRMLVNGGLVGRVLDPTGEIGASGYCIYAYQASSDRVFGVRRDGSFTVQRSGTGITLRFRSCIGDTDYLDGFLTDPDSPSQIMTWDIVQPDIVDLGAFSLERPSALSGRVVDQYGVPMADAMVYFVDADGPLVEMLTAAMTDENGWYVVEDPPTGSVTAYVANHTWPIDPNQSFAPVWLGNTADRSQAETMELDGSALGGVDFVVRRGRHDTESFNDAGTLTTDWDRNGADANEPLAITAFGPFSGSAALGVGFAPEPMFAGFRGLPFEGRVIYDPPAGAPTLHVQADIATEFMPGPLDEMQTTWNGRRLVSCESGAPPCVDSVTQDSQVHVDLLLPEGGDLAFVWGPAFLDTGDSIFVNDIDWLADQGVTKGCSPPVNDFFCPTETVTRGQMAAFLVRYLGLTDAGTVDFVDDDGSVFEADIEKLAVAGITKGCNPPANDMFCPNDPVTRGQMAAFLSRALRLPQGSGIDFVDDDESIFEDAIERLATAGITRGCNPPTNDRFCPNETVTREQMAAFLHRAAVTTAGIAGVHVAARPAESSVKYPGMLDRPEPIGHS